MRNSLLLVLLLATFGALALTGGAAAHSPHLAMQSPPRTGETFSWLSELVELDENARMITVEARVVGEQARAEFGRLKTGERVMLTWSGLDKYSDAIWRADRFTGNKSEERFTFPVEFVSFDGGRHYVTFKVQIPANSMANLKALKPGEWVTATSPHGPSANSTPVTMVEPYVKSTSATRSN